MNIHLSVDLDYWYKKSIAPNCLTFLNKIIHADVPTTVYTEHHVILRNVNHCYSKVINIDYHSDICAQHKGWPECGSWANFFPGRQNAKFEWRLPNWRECVVKGYGLCHDGHDEWSDDNPFKHQERHGWNKISRGTGIKVPWRNVADVSIVLSEKYSRASVIADSLNFLIEARKKGLVKFYGRNVQPTINRMLRETRYVKN